MTAMPTRFTESFSGPRWPGTGRLGGWPRHRLSGRHDHGDSGDDRDAAGLAAMTSSFASMAGTIDGGDYRVPDQSRPGWRRAEARQVVQEWVTDDHGCLVDQRGMELLATERSFGSAQCRLSQIDAARLHQVHGSIAGDLLSKPEIFGQAEISGHRASRSSSSLSRSSNLRARPVKSLSSRTRSTSLARESTMSVFTLVPRTRATASAWSASSSGSRTVVCLVMKSCYHDIMVSLLGRKRIVDRAAVSQVVTVKTSGNLRRVQNSPAAVPACTWPMLTSQAVRTMP